MQQRFDLLLIGRTPPTDVELTRHLAEVRGLTCYTVSHMVRMAMQCSTWAAILACCRFQRIPTLFGDGRYRMRHLTNEHDPQALTRSSPRYLRGLIFLIVVGLGGGSLW